MEIDQKLFFENADTALEKLRETPNLVIAKIKTATNRRVGVITLTLKKGI